MEFEPEGHNSVFGRCCSPLLVSVYFQWLLDVEGQSDSKPIRIPHITAKEFEYLIEAIYNMFV